VSDYTLKAPGSPAKWEAEARWSFCYMGGRQRDRRSYPGSRVREAGFPPITSRVTSRSFLLTLGRPM
jgi:hypothetical protein